MKADLKVTFNKNDKITGIVRQAGLQALHETNKMLLDEANKTVPLDTGLLKDTGDVSSSYQQLKSVISYDTPYAVKVHEDPTLNFKGQGRHKWLEKTLLENGRQTQTKLANEMQKNLLSPPTSISQTIRTD